MKKAFSESEGSICKTPLLISNFKILILHIDTNVRVPAILTNKTGIFCILVAI